MEFPPRVTTNGPIKRGGVEIQAIHTLRCKSGSDGISGGLSPIPPPPTLPPQMSRLILLPAADHVFYSEGDQEEDENDADDGELVPLVGLVGQKEEDEKEDLTELLDLDVVLVVDVIG